VSTSQTTSKLPNACATLPTSTSTARRFPEVRGLALDLGKPGLRARLLLGHDRVLLLQLNRREPRRVPERLDEERLDELPRLHRERRDVLRQPLAEDRLACSCIGRS